MIHMPYQNPYTMSKTVPPLDLSLLSELSTDTDLVSPTQVTTWMRSWRSSFWCGFVVGGLTVLVTQRVSRLIRTTA